MLPGPALPEPVVGGAARHLLFRLPPGLGGDKVRAGCPLARPFTTAAAPGLVTCLGLVCVRFAMPQVSVVQLVAVEHIRRGGS